MRSCWFVIIAIVERKCLNRSAVCMAGSLLPSVSPAPLCHLHPAESSQVGVANTLTSGSSSCTATASTTLGALPRCTRAAAALTGFRRTTWEGVAFTAQEQAKLEAVHAALDADRQQQQLCKVWLSHTIVVSSPSCNVPIVLSQLHNVDAQLGTTTAAA